jgi:hypothetical protein
MSSKEQNDHQDALLRDVDIRLTSEKKIHIHSSFLISCSGYFASSLKKAWVERSEPLRELENAPIVYNLSLEDDPADDFLILQVYEVLYAKPALTLYLAFASNG